MFEHEASIGRDRMAVVAGITTCAALAWVVLFRWAWSSTHPLESNFLFLWLMWSVMMVAMMLPSTLPFILMYARTSRQKTEQSVATPATVLTLGWTCAWICFSAIAAAGQAQLHAAALLSSTMQTESGVVGGAVLICAGLFQFTQMKHACLIRCRSPAGFMITEWQDGGWGAFTMGFRHALHCIGCCWLLMALLLVTGVMNLFWVAAVALFIHIEKIFPRGERLAKAGGIALIVAGITLLFT